MFGTQNVCRADVNDCKRCGKSKPLIEFYKRLDKEARCKTCVSEIRKQSYSSDPEKVKARVKKYRIENPEKIRDCKLRQAYGVGLNYFQAKLKKQGGACGACKRNVKSVWRGKEVNMALDHNHETGEPRGVLCIKCNRALGLLEDDQEIISGLLSYIKKYQKLG